MAKPHVEIERKFLVRDTTWPGTPHGSKLRQGYLSTDPERSVRVRTVDDRAFLTIKGKPSGQKGLEAPEYEFAIPPEQAAEILRQLCKRPLIEKTRYNLRFGNLKWEIDVFEGENAPLVVAEVELTAADQQVMPPPWLGEEVSGDPRYYNSNLSQHPYGRWWRTEYWQRRWDELDEPGRAAIRSRFSGPEYYALTTRYPHLPRDILQRLYLWELAKEAGN